jgi:hypothetical protein
MTAIARGRDQLPELPTQADKRRVVYLACPYSDGDARVRKERFEAATRAAAQLIKQGHIVYSPITMTHPIDVVLAGGVGTLGSDYWVNFDAAFMEFCSEMIILRAPGWDESQGIKREVEYFSTHEKRIRFMDSDGSLHPLNIKNAKRTN